MKTLTGVGIKIIIYMPDKRQYQHNHYYVLEILSMKFAMNDHSVNDLNSNSSTTDEEKEDEYYQICLHCGDKPCFWTSYKNDIISSTMTMIDNYLKPNSFFRKKAYQRYVLYKYGRLGKGNRVKIPLCVLEGVRSVWPETDSDNYMGHKDSYEQTF